MSDFSPTSFDPDSCAPDFLGYVPDPVRYDTDNWEPFESTMTVASLVPQGSRVLDIGCGIGAIAACIQRERAAEVIGIEPNSARADSARKRNIEVYNDLLTPTLAAKLGKFDVVVFADVLEHLSDPGSLVRLAASSLKPNGRLIISVPNVAHWSTRISLLAGRFEYDQFGIMDATHLRWFTRRSLFRFLQNVGFSIVEERHTAGVTLPANSRSRLLRMLPSNLRRKLIVKLSQIAPGPFACQIVVSASKTGELNEQVPA